MREAVVKQAKSWRFNCELTDGGNWQISSPQLKETWQLSEREEGWLLSVGNVPQIKLSADEALRFLERHYRLLGARTGLSQ